MRCVADALYEVCDDLLILGRTDVSASRYHAVVPEARVRTDVQAQSGPLVALRGALEEARAPWVIVAPCDAPALSAIDVKRLLTEGRKKKTVAVAASGADVLYDLFCSPRSLMEERLKVAHRLEDLCEDARVVALTASPGLNVNEPP